MEMKSRHLDHNGTKKMKEKRKVLYDFQIVLRVISLSNIKKSRFYKRLQVVTSRSWKGQSPRDSCYACNSVNFKTNVTRKWTLKKSYI